ncbi:O-antigen ligase family protein [uncultured Desulfobacter sp.]|uniref:O-antigen ligase family protein n=1 Tax=uncultured Desulfobacter sp. TaxID=240139 RepID=UPI002AABBBA2|nr:O-antigen ligase family protein [uncultured Desulfobacter sp.]
MLNAEKYKISYSTLLIIVLSFLTSGIILCGSGKVIAAFCLLPVLTIFYLNAPPFAKIVIPMVMLTFPITIQALGKDAFSTGTLAIFSTLAWALSKYKFGKTLAYDKNILGFLLLLVVIALIGMVTQTPGAYWGPAIRHYLNFISSVAIFFLIVHSQYMTGTANSKKEYIEKLISVLLSITVVHVFLSFLIFNFQWIEKYFSIFLSRNQEHLGRHIVHDVYVRATSVFTGGEEFGELLILLFPFALYKLFLSRKKIYWFIIGSLLIGVVISGTRSAFLLIVFQTLAFVYILVPKKYNSRKIVITVGFAIVFILMLPVFMKYSYILMDRVQVTLDQVGQDDDIVTISNRSTVWPLAWDTTVKTISLFGHGPIQAARLGFPVRNFHNLYLSLIFQFGIIGSMVFLMFFYALAKRLFVMLKNSKKNKGPEYLLAVTCLLSLFCFLINEIKFEFNRGDSYQQFVWIFFGIFYLTGTIWKNYKT